jgi:hypothetical protein
MQSMHWIRKAYKIETFACCRKDELCTSKILHRCSIMMTTSLSVGLVPGLYDLFSGGSSDPYVWGVMGYTHSEKLLHRLCSMQLR